jgi:hypothetical protein
MTRAIVRTVAGVGLLAMLASPAAAVSIDLVPALGGAAAGGEVSVAVTVSGLGDRTAPSLSLFDLDIFFDPLVLLFSGIHFGDPDPRLGDQLDPTGQGLVFNDAFEGPGTIGFFDQSLLPDLSVLDRLQVGSFTLATLAFAALAPGFTSLDLVIRELLDSQGHSLGAEVGAAAVAVTPSPSSGFFLLAALGAATLGRRILRGRRGQGRDGPSSR